MSTRASRLPLLLGVLAALLVAEAGIRQIFWLPYAHDPRLGSILPAGTRARYCREGCGTSYWAADGVRRAEPIDPARASILVLGDSFTEALMIDDAHVYTERTEQALAAAAVPRQVLNAGRSGTSAADYVASAAFYTERFAPRWTVIQLRAPDLESDAWDGAKTHFRGTAEGGIEVVEVRPVVSRVNRYLAPLRRRSALASLGSIRAREFAAAAATEPPMFRGAQGARPAPEPVRAYPIEEELEALVAAWHGSVTFLFLPEFDPRDPSARAATERRFASACAARRLSCANLRDAFPSFAELHASPYGFPNSAFNSGHMNDAGHAAAAEVLRAELLRLAARDLL